MALGVAGLMLQACCIPVMTTKNADSHLPDSFKHGVSQPASTATVKWKDFFEDPNLLRNEHEIT